MIEDPIVAEARRFRSEHAEKYGHDLKRSFAKRYVKLKHVLRGSVRCIQD
jgi:hypothetical protein